MKGDKSLTELLRNEPLVKDLEHLSIMPYGTNWECKARELKIDYITGKYGITPKELHRAYNIVAIEHEAYVLDIVRRIRKEGF
jgi:hypothetical protein